MLSISKWTISCFFVGSFLVALHTTEQKISFKLCCNLLDDFEHPRYNLLKSCEYQNFSRGRTTDELKRCFCSNRRDIVSVVRMSRPCVSCKTIKFNRLIVPTVLRMTPFPYSFLLPCLRLTYRISVFYPLDRLYHFSSAKELWTYHPGFHGRFVRTFNAVNCRPTIGVVCLICFWASRNLMTISLRKCFQTFFMWTPPICLHRLIVQSQKSIQIFFVFKILFKHEQKYASNIFALFLWDTL